MNLNQFHTGCIDPVIRKSNCCPLDWHVIYNPLTWNPQSSRAERSLAPSSEAQSKRTDEQISEFFLPGIGLQVKKGSASSLLRTVTSVPSVAGYPSPSSVDLLTQGFLGLCINSSHIEPYTRMKHSHTNEQRSRNRSLSLGQTIPAPAERRVSFPNSPSTVSLTLNVQSALARTQNDQQRLIKGSSSMTPAYGRVRPLRNGHLRQRPRPGRLDMKDLHL